MKSGSVIGVDMPDGKRPFMHTLGWMRVSRVGRPTKRFVKAAFWFVL